MLRKYTLLFFCLCILIYIIFAGFSITEPLTGDSSYLYISAKAFNNKTLHPVHIDDPHPPLYVYLLSLVDKLATLNPPKARLIGILCFITTLILIYVLTQTIFKDNKNRHSIGLISIFLYAINPMAIQGSLFISIDTTIMVPLMLYFVYLFVGLEHKTRCLLLGIIFGLNLWAKLATPFSLIPTIFIFYLLDAKFKRGFKESSLILLIGSFLFIATWGIYCYFSKRPFHSPFSHSVGAISYNSPFFWHLSITKTVLNVIRTLFRLILYISPFYFLIFILAVWKRIREYILRRRVDYTDLLLILSIIILIGYLFTGGLSYSLPRCHYPFFSLAVIIIASFIADRIQFKRNHLFLYLFSIIIIAAYNIFIVGDFLYSSDYALRESLIIHGKITQEVMKNLIFQLTLYILPFFLILSILKIKKNKLYFPQILFIWTVASCFSMNILQAKADYHTIYCYGGKGTEEVVSFVRKIKKEKSFIIATYDILFNIDEKEFLALPEYRLSDDDFLDPEKFIPIINNKNPDFIIYGISSNTIEQYRNVFNNPRVIGILRNDFLRKDIGSYTIWRRKEYGIGKDET